MHNPKSLYAEYRPQNLQSVVAIVEFVSPSTKQERIELTACLYSMVVRKRKR